MQDLEALMTQCQKTLTARDRRCNVGRAVFHGPVGIAFA